MSFLGSIGSTDSWYWFAGGHVSVPEFIVDVETDMDMQVHGDAQDREDECENGDEFAASVSMLTLWYNIIHSSNAYKLPI